MVPNAMPAPVVRARMHGRPVSRLAYFRLKHAARLRDEAIARAHAEYAANVDLIFATDGAVTVTQVDPVPPPWRRGLHALEGLSVLAHMTPRDLWRSFRKEPA